MCDLSYLILAFDTSEALLAFALNCCFGLWYLLLSLDNVLEEFACWLSDLCTCHIKRTVQCAL